MTTFSVELDYVRQEIERLTAELNRLRAEYDLDDDENDDAEQVEIDGLEIAIRDLSERQERLEAQEEGMLPYIDPTPVVRVPEISITGSEMISYYAVEPVQFFGTRMAIWAQGCAGAISDTGSRLNVPVPEEGFTTDNILASLSAIPKIGKYASVARTIYNTLATGIQTINIRPNMSFADIGRQLFAVWNDFSLKMGSDTPERRMLYHMFVTAFRGNDQSDLVNKDLINQEIESYVSTMTAPNLVAREFLLRCLDCLDDPLIEMEGFSERAGHETGDVTISFRYREAEFSIIEGYIDDAPDQFVQELRQNYGDTTRCIDLPLAMRFSILITYPEEIAEDPHAPTHLRGTVIQAYRRSRAPGNESFDFENVGGDTSVERLAEEAARNAFLREKPYRQVTLGQLQGD